MLNFHRKQNQEPVKFKTMKMNHLLFPILFCLLAGCSTPKDYQIGNKMVTKKKYDRKSDRVTKRFIKRTDPETLRIFLNMEVLYDTTNLIQDENQ